MRFYVYLATGLIVALLTPSSSWAEKVDMTKEQMTKVATHIMVGKVKEIYSSETKHKGWQYKHYLTEITPKKHEKGEGLEEQPLIYVRYWTRKWIGDGRMPLSTTGHRGLPSKGDTVRLYLARNAYDGFTDRNDDGGLNVLGANGFEMIEKADKDE